MLLQLQIFYCGVTRRNHLHVSLSLFYCSTGFSFLEEHLLIRWPSFCYYFHLFFLDMVFYPLTCKFWCLWRHDILHSFILVQRLFYLGLFEKISLPFIILFAHIIFLFLLQYSEEIFQNFPKEWHSSDC